MVKITVRSYRDLIVWQKAVDTALLCYRATRSFPGFERYGLISQINRAAVSVASNIAEGHGRRPRGDFMHHLSIAYGSLMELETHLIIAARLAYLNSANANSLLERTSEIGRMLNGLRKHLRPAASAVPDP
jgi:four helix bundle protein